MQIATMVEHAKYELQKAGVFGSKYNESVAEDVSNLLKLFSEQGHSGFSAGIVITLFNTLAKREPLSPLTGAADEWDDMSEYSGTELHQNKRDSRVFKEGSGNFYQIEATNVVKEDGSSFLCSNVTKQFDSFPYSPSVDTISIDDCQRINACADCKG